MNHLKPVNFKIQCHSAIAVPFYEMQSQIGGLVQTAMYDFTIKSTFDKRPFTNVMFQPSLGGIA